MKQTKSEIIRHLRYLQNCQSYQEYLNDLHHRLTNLPTNEAREDRRIIAESPFQISKFHWRAQYDDELWIVNSNNNKAPRKVKSKS